MNILAQWGPLALFFAFAIGHALADFPLQGEYLAREKVRQDADSLQSWAIALSAHALIHGGAVWIISGSPLIGTLELVAHGLIDWRKGEGKFGLMTDQLLHLGCKAAYVALLAFQAAG